VVPVASTTPAPTRQAATSTAAGGSAPRVAPIALAAASATRSVASPPGVTTPAVPLVPAASVPVSNAMVVFRTTGPSWVEVTDGRGSVALRRLMAAGESAGASGNLPLTVTIGSVNATSVQVRGKPFDLSRFSRDNVARFEVK
jgi:cytoskeleton protein RodZ